jgi:hypothetical protein
VLEIERFKLNPTREELFQIYCDDTNAGDWHRPQENYIAGYRQAMKHIKEGK